MVRRFWRLLERRERRALVSLVPLMLVAAAVEVVGVAAVIPFLSVLADPDSLSTLPLVGPIVIASEIDDVGLLVRLTGLLFAAVILLANIMLIVKQYWLLRFSWSLNHTLSTRLLRHYLQQAYVFTLTRNTGTMTNKLIVEVRQVVEAGLRSAMEIVVRVAMIVALVGFLIALDPQMAVVVFVALGLLYGAIYQVTKGVLGRLGRETVVASASRVKAINEALGGFKELKVAGREASALLAYEVPSRRFGDLQATIGAISTLPRYALEALAIGGMVLIATLMAGRDGSFAATLPLLGAYAFAGMRLLPSIQALFASLARIRSVTGALETVEEDFMHAIVEEGALEAVPTPLPFTGAIELRGVGFTYPATDHPVLYEVDIEIPRGQSIAFVGRTGSGKTTLVDVVLGLLEVEAGDILLDGVPVAAEHRRAYRRLFGYVPQTIFLMDDTIARNVAFGVTEEEIDQEAVRTACELAQIADFVEQELPAGYATVVGERGVRLSGGQRQRIGIARALYHRPEILVFDEATSALDVHTERHVYAALAALAKTHTIITVAHRLETVTASDHVVVLEYGRIVDQGPPSEVLVRYRQGVLGA